MFVVQDGSVSDGGSGTPLSDRASLVGVDFQNENSPEHHPNQGPWETRVSERGLKEEEGVEASSHQTG